MRTRSAWILSAAVAALIPGTALSQVRGGKHAAALPVDTNALPTSYPPIVTARIDAPNILLIMTDDVGFGASSAFGGPVPTPNLERLANEGLKYNNFQTTGMCSPSRAALLTGRNHHAVGTGSLTDFPMGAPGYTGMLPPTAATIGEVLRENGYNTAWIGKHHNVPHGPFAGAGPNDYMPNGLGFEYFFGFIGSDTDQWHPTLYRNGIRVIDASPQPILDQRLADDAVQWLHQQQANGQGKPFLLYYAPGSAHAPHQAPAEWISKFRGKFDAGWEEARNATLKRQKAMGIVPPGIHLPAWPVDVPHWDSLSPQEKDYQARTMEAFAGELAFQDAQLGRLLDELDRMGLRDNTLIIFVNGDNGPDSAGSPQGSVAEAGENANRRLSPVEHWTLKDQVGGPKVGSNYGTGWAQAMATPFPYYKQIASHLGGTRNGLVISWPAKIAARGLRTQYAHITDIFPTVLDAAGVPAPESVRCVKQQQVDGVDLTYSFSDPRAASRHRLQYYEMLGNRAIYSDGWLASTLPEQQPWQMGQEPDASKNRAPFYKWALYDIRRDFNQTTDVSARYPQKLAEMKALFDQQAARYNVNPVNDRTDFARITSEARAYTKPHDQYRYWGKGLTVTHDDAPPIEGRAFTITADLTGGDGVLVATGSWFGGWSFGIKDGYPQVHHALTIMPADQFDLVSSQAIGPGEKARVTFDFDYDGGGFGKGGIVSIAINGQAVGTGRVNRSIIVADPYSETFDIGLDSGVPVIDLGGKSNAYTGNLEKLTIDLGPAGQKRP